ncbi:MAG: ComEC/Rec2 family competence protein [Candidatus Gracilibacteria bacterium]|nr:ComEC/Rec2 family competence protein [Candidatus Gracilibacteria bacterium]
MKQSNKILHFSFIILLSAFIIGIFTSNIISNLYFSILILSFCGIFMVGLYIYSKKFGIFFIVFFFGLLFGILYSSYNLNEIAEKENILFPYLGQKEDLIFEIESLYKKQENYTSYIAKLDKIGNKNIKNVDIKILLKITGNYLLQSKDLIKSKSKLDIIDNFSDTFNYKKFLNSKGVLASSYLYSFEKIGANNKTKFEIYIEFIRQKFLSSIKSIFPPDEATLLAGILIGERQDLSKNLQSDFNNSGLTHIVAVSGFNITIIIVFLTYIFKIFPIIIRTIFISFSVIFFVAIVGDSIAAIRAAIMGLLAYYILISGRDGNSFVVLLISAFLIVLYNPLIINYDISFQLSFLAVLGLIYTKDFFDKIFSFLPKILAIRESFVLTLSAFSFTLPIMIIYFGQVSILSPLANVAIGWTLPFTMLFGFLRVLADFFNQNLSYIVGYLSRRFLAYILEIAHFFGNFGFSILKINFGDYAYSFLSFYYIVLVFLILWFLPTKKEA